MQIEIRELVITAAISENSQKPPSGKAQTTQKAVTEEKTSTLVAACVEQVLAILREKSER